MKYFVLLCLLNTGLQVSATDSFERANKKFACITWEIIDATVSIAICNFVGHYIVNSFDATKDMENKSERILAACMALYAGCLALSVYERMQEARKNEYIELEAHPV